MVEKREELGMSEEFLAYQAKVSHAAKVDRPVLCVGERGSGKELAASKLHYLSSRWDNPFVTLNCATLPESLIESELFGYEKGAFTGADKPRKGRFELANGGTLFLDEIGLIPLPVQEKILRVVEYGTFERVGSSKTTEVDVRIVGATNANLPKLCKEGRFKEDLLDRLSFEVIFVPPLRHRGEDILLLAHHFASRMAREMGVYEDVIIPEEIEEQILAYHWPGNIRELKNVIERGVYHGEGLRIGKLVLDPFQNPYGTGSDVATCAGEPATGGSVDFTRASHAGDSADSPDVDSGEANATVPEIPAPPPNSSTSPLTNLHNHSLDQMGELLLQIQSDFVKRALEAGDGNKRKAAELMGVSYDQFRGLERKVKASSSKNV